MPLADREKDSADDGIIPDPDSLKALTGSLARPPWRLCSLTDYKFAASASAPGCCSSPRGPMPAVRPGVAVSSPPLPATHLIPRPRAGDRGRSLCVGSTRGSHMESDDEVADAAEDGEKADPKDQQGGSSGDVLL